jgi:hypothetical protein
MSGYTKQPYHLGRTVEWGHWGITFMEPQPDLALNYGVITGYVGFGVVNGCGPQDGTLGSPLRQSYKAMCKAWVEDGIYPEGAFCPIP